MSLGLYEIRTISTPPVLAKDAPKATLKRPAMSFADDAMLCNKRAKHIWGRVQYVSDEAVAKYKTRAMLAAEHAEATDIKVMAVVLTFPGPVPTPEIIKAANILSRETVRQSLCRLRGRGLIKSNKLAPNKVIWWIA
jgi:hypothetical protein